MYKIEVLAFERQHPAWLEEAIQIYIKRMKGQANLSFSFVKSDEELKRRALKAKSLIVLDALGASYDSEQFSSFLVGQLVKGGSQVTFLIGGAEGLSDELKAIEPKIRLSSLTFTHQIARLILVEQIYRALEIAKNSAYHK
ncbi:MAG: rlmH [Chlamydiales bacterium]|jgi:23S rRNA (pseudouridine1915-N3)-methyltransferase|nr:rlmH [Chlamydiales bacterium]